MTAHILTAAVAAALAMVAGCGPAPSAPAPAETPAPAPVAPDAGSPASPEPTPTAPLPTPDAAPSDAGVSGPLPLRPGVYVTAGSGCAAPPNAGFRIYDGRGISGSATRDCRAAVTSVDGTEHTVANSCIDTYSGDRTTTGQTIRINAPDRFRLTEAGEDASQTFRLCPAGEAPNYLEALTR